MSLTDLLVHVVEMGLFMRRYVARHIASALLIIIALSSLAACGSSEGNDKGVTDQTVENIGESATQEPEALAVATGQAVADQMPTVTPAIERATTTTSQAVVDVTPTVTPIVDLEDCSGTIDGSIAKIESLEALAWTSHQVVVGRVVEQQDSIWGHAHNPIDPSRRMIYTNYLVEVTKRLRGVPSDMITVRQWGGSVEGCTLTSFLEQKLEVGEQVLLFVRESNPPSSTLTYSLLGGDQGHWSIGADSVVTNDVPHLARYSGKPLAELTSEISSILAGEPQDLPWIREWLVPLEEAPVP